MMLGGTVWGPLKVPSGFRTGPRGGGGEAPLKLLGFEHLNSVSVNDYV